MSESEQGALDTSLLGSSSPALKKLFAYNDLFFALGVATVLMTLLIPLPTFLLDLLLSFSIAIGIATLVVVLSVQ